VEQGLVKATILNPTYTARELIQRCWDVADACGWNQGKLPIPEQIALIHSEASEALESYRNNEELIWFREATKGNFKPEGLLAEYADIVIRVFHYARTMTTPEHFEKIISDKLDYNATRGFKHGGKVC